MILLHDDSTFLDMSRFSNICLTTELGALRSSGFMTDINQIVDQYTLPIGIEVWNPSKPPLKGERVFLGIHSGQTDVHDYVPTSYIQLLLHDKGLKTALPGKSS